MFLKIVAEKIKTHILCLIPPSPPKKNHATYEIMWKNTLQPDWPQQTTKCRAEKMQFACRENY
jgi:hypothetical protein